MHYGIGELPGKKNEGTMYWNSETKNVTTPGSYLKNVMALL